MTIIEQIKAEIERRKKELEKDKTIHPANQAGRIKELDLILSRLSALEKSERPEPYNPVYDEAYLNEKIKKATESWKGVDVDAMLAECRGYDEEKSEKPSEGLEEELDRFIASGKSVTVEDCGTYKVSYHDFKKVARHFAQWGAEHSDSSETPNDLEEAAEEYSKDYESGPNRIAINAFIAGAKWQKEQMMKEAVETYYGYVNGITKVFLPETTLKGVKEGYNRIIILKDDGGTK